MKDLQVIGPYTYPGWLLFCAHCSHTTHTSHTLHQTGPRASLYLTLVGILAGFLSTFWAFGYQRTAQRMQEYLDGADVAKIKKQLVRGERSWVAMG